MAKYRKISPKIWNDAKFRSLSDNAKLVFMMLLTHPQTSAIGTMRAYPQGLAAELGWSEQTFRKAFEELLANGMAKGSEKNGLIWLPNFLKYNAPDNPNVVKSWIGSIDDCPECSLLNEVITTIQQYAEAWGEGYLKAFNEGLGREFVKPASNGMTNGSVNSPANGSANGIGNGSANGSANGMPNQEQEQEQEQEKNTNAREARGRELSDFPPEYEALARKFQNEVVIAHGNTAPKITEELILHGVEAIDQAVRLDGMEFPEMRSALLWAITDEFWGQNLKSLARMRNKTKSGATKVQDVVSRYRKSRPQINRPPIDPDRVSANGCIMPAN